MAIRLKSLLKVASVLIFLKVINRWLECTRGALPKVLPDTSFPIPRFGMVNDSVLSIRMQVILDFFRTWAQPGHCAGKRDFRDWTAGYLAVIL